MDNLQPLPLVLLGAVAVLTLYFLWRSRNSTKRNLPPCVPALPMVGSIPFLGLTGTDDYLRFQKKVQKYGNIYSFWLGQKFVVLISGYDLIRTALLDQSIIMAGRPNSEMYSIRTNNPKCLGLGSPSYTAPGWKKERQVSLAILKDFGFGKGLMEPRIKREVDDLLSHLKTSDGEPQDPRQAFELSVGNVLVAIILGKRYPINNCEELRPYLNSLDKQLKLNAKVAVADFVPVMRYLPSHKKILQEVARERLFLQNFIINLIKELEEAHTEGNEDSFVDAFMERTGEEYSRERLLYIIRDLLIAGTETSATTLQWSLVYMANNPNIQRKVQDEIDQIVGKERLVNLEDKPFLPYTEAVMLEVQRLATLLPSGLPHMTLSDTELSGYHIPEKTMVIINLWSVLRDPVLWPEPDKFRPERFLDDCGDVVHRSELIPFSLGRRSCLGEVLARQELFLFFCGLVQTFEITPPDGITKFDEKGRTGMTRTPLPFEVVLKARN